MKRETILSILLNVAFVLCVFGIRYFYVKKEYKKYYDVLIKNKIIFFNPKEAAEHVNLNLSRIEEWWLEKKRQKGN